MTNPLSAMEVINPPNMTFAMGLWISLPGRWPPNAMGSSANADVNAVIKIGFNRSSEP